MNSLLSLSSKCNFYQRDNNKTSFLRVKLGFRGNNIWSMKPEFHEVIIFQVLSEVSREKGGLGGSTVFQCQGFQICSDVGLVSKKKFKHKRCRILN